MGRYNVKRKLNIDRTISVCSICNRACIGPKSLKSHITQMHTNSSKDTSHRGKPKGTSAWNSGLSKKTDMRVLRLSEKVSTVVKAQVIAGTYVYRVMSDAGKQRLSEKQSLHNSGGKCKWFEVNGIKVQGTWERGVATMLTNTGTMWERGKRFSYYMNGKHRSYTPDFYLPDYNLYLEIKGYWWGNDKEKMQCVLSQNPSINIKIIEKKEYMAIMDGELVW